jgi:hypothetical protein
LSKQDRLDPFPVSSRNARKQLSKIIDGASVNTIAERRLNEELELATGHNPDDLSCFVDPLPKPILAVRHFWDRHPVVLAAAAFCGANVAIASRWIVKPHSATMVPRSANQGKLS